jgi:hypothetical protein
MIKKLISNNFRKILINKTIKKLNFQSYHTTRKVFHHESECTCCSCKKVEVNTSLVQKNAPEFSGEAVMPTKDFKSLSLSDFKDNYLLIFFYPLGSFLF